MKSSKLQHPSSKETPTSKFQKQLRGYFRISDFGFRPSFGFRISAFGFSTDAWNLVLGVFLGFGAWSLELPAAPAETILLYGATIHTASGAALSPGQVLIKDGKIAAVGTALSAAGAETIEL